MVKNLESWSQSPAARLIFTPTFYQTCRCSKTRAAAFPLCCSLALVPKGTSRRGAREQWGDTDGWRAGFPPVALPKESNIDSLCFFCVPLPAGNDTTRRLLADQSPAQAQPLSVAPGRCACSSRDLSALRERKASCGPFWSVAMKGGSIESSKTRKQQLNIFLSVSALGNLRCCVTVPKGFSSTTSAGRGPAFPGASRWPPSRFARWSYQGWDNVPSDRGISPRRTCPEWDLISPCALNTI